MSNMMLNESWSTSQRRKRSKRCNNPKGFTMKQFCKNFRTRNKKEQKKNESIEELLRQLIKEEINILFNNSN